MTDPLSDIVVYSDARCSVTRVMRCRGDWHYRFDAPGLVKFVAIVRGVCWLRHGEAEPRLLSQGAVLMLRGEDAFAMATDLARPIDASDRLVTTATPVAGHDDDGFLAVCGHVTLHPDRGGLLADALPAAMIVNETDPAATAMRWLLDQLVIEVNASRPGDALATGELAQLLFVHLIRACIAHGATLPLGWVGGLADDRIAHALRLIHRHPEQDWRVGQLAARVGMSRTSFAVRFSALLGTAPLAYLTAWRLRMAERRLRTTGDPLVRIAAAAGYTSTAAFGAAFARMFGLPPKKYRSSVVSPCDAEPGDTVVWSAATRTTARQLKSSEIKLGQVAP